MRFEKNLIQAIVMYAQSVPYIWKHFNFSYRTQKYELSFLLPYILHHVKFNVPWRESENPELKKIWNTSFKTYQKLVQLGVLKGTYINLLKKFFIKCPAGKLKYRLTDTTLVANKYGSDKVKYSGKHKRNGTKVSFITDSTGIGVISLRIDEGSAHDKKILNDQLDEDLLIDDELNDKYRKYIIADPAYDSAELLNKIKNCGYIPIIKPNNRNTKDPEKIRKLNKEDNEIYKKRLTIENKTNARFKTCRRVDVRYDRSLEMFEGSVYFALLFMIIEHV